MKPPAPQTMPEKLMLQDSKIHFWDGPDGKYMGKADCLTTESDIAFAAELVARWNSHASLVRQRDALAEALRCAETDLSDTYERLKQRGATIVSLGQFRRLNAIREVLSTLKLEGAKGE